MDKSPGRSDSEDGIDINLVRAEISAEAERWRNRDPEIKELEQRIEQEWLSIAPEGAVTQNEVSLDRFEKVATVKVKLPHDPRKAIRYIKKAIHKATAWNFRYLAGQLNGIFTLLAGHLRHVNARIDNVETVGYQTDRFESLGIRFPPLSPAAAEAIAKAIGTKYCLVLSCGKGELVEAIYSNGGRGYGVERNAVEALEGIRQGLDIRVEGVLEQLSSLEDKSCESIVLAREVETLPVAALIKILDQVDRILLSSGVLGIAVGDPSNRSVPEAELLSGHGLSPQTWQYLLDQRGYTTRLMKTADPRVTEVVVAERP